MKLLLKIKSKIKNQNGESLAEVLVALLVSCLGMVLLAMMITTSVNLIDTSKRKMRDYVGRQNEIERHTSDSDQGNVSIKVGSNTTTIDNVNYIINDIISGREVIAYYK